MSSMVSLARNDSPTRMKFVARAGGCCSVGFSGRMDILGMPKLGVDIVFVCCLDRFSDGYALLKNPLISNFSGLLEDLDWESAWLCKMLDVS